jgi:hypothetical protein
MRNTIYMNVNTCHLSSTLLNSFVQYFTAREHGREYELKNIYTRTHIAEMNIVIDNTL